VGEAGFAEDEVESLRSKLVPYGLLSSSSFHMMSVGVRRTKRSVSLDEQVRSALRTQV
jgi:hypothetical protein